MAGTLVGCDPEQMTRLADNVSRSAGSLELIATTASSSIGQSAAFWFGADAECFRRLWATGHAPAMRAAVAALNTVASVVIANRDRQIETSATTGTGGGPVPPGAPPLRSTPIFFQDSGRVTGGSQPLLDPYTTGFALVDTATAGYVLAVTADGLVVRADASFAGGVQGQVGTSGQVLGTDYAGQLGGFLGTRGAGDATLELTGDGYLLDLDGRLFSGAEVYADGSLGFRGNSVAVDGSASAGGTLAGNLLSEFDGRTVRTQIGGEAFLGAKAEAGTNVSFLDGHYQQGGSVGVSTGLGGNFSGGSAFGLDEVGIDLDLGLTLGLGFDLSVNASFSPSGLYHDAEGVAVAGVDVVNDVASAGVGVVKGLTGLVPGL